MVIGRMVIRNWRGWTSDIRRRNVVHNSATGSNVLHMPRPRENPAAPLVGTITLRCAPQMIDYIDSVRGGKSRASFIRNLVRADAVEQRKQGTYHPSMDPGQREHYHDHPQGPPDTTP